MVVMQNQCGSRWKYGYGAESGIEYCVK